MRANLSDNLGERLLLESMRFGTVRDAALTTNFSIPSDGPIAYFFDPKVDVIITLPVMKKGLFHMLFHIGAGFSLTVKDSGGATLIVLTSHQSISLVCSGYEWTQMGGSGTIVVEGGALTSPDGSLDISAVTDGVELTVSEPNVDHDLLMHFVANKHIDHSAVSTLTAANSGLAGGGTLAASRSISLDVSNLVTVAPASGDFYPFYDISGAVTGKATITTIASVLNHDTLAGYVASQHVDHSTISIIAGPGLTGGGSIDNTRSISLDIENLSTGAVNGLDSLVYYDESEDDYNRVTINTLLGMGTAGIGEAPNDGLQYARRSLAWSEVVQQAYGGTHNYLFNAGTVAPPASGSVRFNNASQDLATNIYINYTTNDSIAINTKTYFLARVKVGDTFYFQDKDQNDKWKVFQLNAAFTDNGTYATMPVTFIAGGSDLSAARIVVSREGAGVSNPIGEAPNDGTYYARRNLAWAATVGEAPSDGQMYARRDGAWVVVTGGVGGATAGQSMGLLLALTKAS